ncbi:MAG: LptA/OstA family protein [Gammaproteobacteria bacterium]
MEHSIRNRWTSSLLPAVGFACCLLPGLPVAAIAQQVPDVPEVSMLRSLPIDLDADSSESDRKRNRLVFRGLHIRQGQLRIDADEATATRLDFENTRWEFSGNVKIENSGTTAWAEYADIMFQEHRIRSAQMTGKPVRFEQTDIAEDDQTKVTTTRGQAEMMEYDVDKGIVSMLHDAWLSDGSNEVSGDRISYDLIREIIIADADESGQVRMKIIPPEGGPDTREADTTP